MTKCSVNQLECKQYNFIANNLLTTHLFNQEQPPGIHLMVNVVQCCRFKMNSHPNMKIQKHQTSENV